MPIIQLETLEDPRLSAYRFLRDPELVRHQGLFVAEGRLVVERLVAAQRYAIRSLLLSTTALAALHATVAQLHAEVPVFVCPVDRFLALTGVNVHRGCLALVERPPALDVEAVTWRARRVVVLEGVTNPDNVGGVFRNAAAFRVDAVLLGPGCSDPLYRKAVRTSVGTTLRVPFSCVAPWPEGLQSLRSRGFQLVALTPKRPSTALEDFVHGPLPERIAILLGAEDHGLSRAVCELADICVRVPIAGEVDSLNVAVASGIVLARLAGAQV